MKFFRFAATFFITVPRKESFTVKFFSFFSKIHLTNSQKRAIIFP